MTNLCSYQYCCGVHRFSQGYGVRVEVPWSPGFRLESESFIWRRLRLWALSVPSRILCNFVAVYLTFVQFILQLKLCWYTVVHLLLQEFKISLKSSLSTQSCHTISPRVGVPQKKNKDSASLDVVQAIWKSWEFDGEQDWERPPCGCVMCRDHSFLQSWKFRAEPRNLLFCRGNDPIRGI